MILSFTMNNFVETALKGILRGRGIYLLPGGRPFDLEYRDDIVLLCHDMQVT